MKKLFSLVLAVAMVLSMACFASAEENTTLTIVAWDVGTTPYYQAQKEAFEATHPGVTIEYVDVASQDWDTKAGTMLSGGDTSDLFMVKQNINIMNWAQQGFAEPLTDYIAKDNYDLSGFVGMEPNYALDGTQYHIDVTWGDQYGRTNLRYFGMSEEQSYQCHPWGTTDKKK